MKKLSYDVNGSTNVISWYDGWLKTQGVKKGKRIDLINKTGIDADMTFGDIAEMIMNDEIKLSKTTKSLFLHVISSAMELPVMKFGYDWDNYLDEEETENLYYSTSIIYN